MANHSVSIVQRLLMGEINSSQVHFPFYNPALCFIWHPYTQSCFIFSESLMSN